MNTQAKPIPTYDEAIAALAEHLVAAQRENAREDAKTAREEGDEDFVDLSGDDGAIAEQVRLALYEDSSVAEDVYHQVLLHLKLLDEPKTKKRR